MGYSTRVDKDKSMIEENIGKLFGLDIILRDNTKRVDGIYKCNKAFWYAKQEIMSNYKFLVNK